MDPGRVLLFSLPNRLPKEDSVREARIRGVKLTIGRQLGGVCEVLAVSLT
jgi:hypothetical protein